MKMKAIVLPVALTVGIATMSGCSLIKPYNTPEFVIVKPNETAFVIPMQGATSSQAKFQSEDFLSKAQVATKRIEIPHTWVKTGRGTGTGMWMDTVTVIKVDRTPVTREWTNDSTTGTTQQKQGVEAESKDSIKFVLGISTTAQIDADKASKFLYKYSGRQLESVMDSEIRNKVETEIIQQFSNYTMDEIRSSKDKIIKDVRDEVTSYFEQRGITITNIGYKGDFKYEDANVQNSINDMFNAEREQKAQAIRNQTEIQKAQAEAKANGVRKSVMEQTVELRKLDIQSKLADKWDGHYPTTMAGNSDLLLNIK